MASGSFDFAADGVLQGRIVWSSASKGAIANSSDVSATLYARRTDSYGPTKGQSWTGYVKIGTAQTNINFSSSVSVGASWVEMAKVSTNVAHGSDGAGSATISGSVTGPSGTSLANRTSSGSSTVVLDKIARYTSITSFSVDKRDETSLTFKWQTADIVDYVWYSTNDGSNWTGYDVSDGTSGSFTVSSLSANTTYNCKIRVRRKDSQLNTDSGRVQQITYDYPYCTNTPNFTIGDKITLNFYNPLNRNITFYIIANGTQIANFWNISTTSYTGIDGESTLTQLYATVPNANSGKYQVKVVYGSSTKTRNNGNTYSVNSNNSKPTFTNFDYDDTNSTTLALTGNSKILIKGYSNNKITISTANKATAKNSATMSSYEAKQGNKSATANYSSSASVTMSMSAIDNNVITVSAIDSRKLSTSVSKTLNSTYYKEYSALVIKSVTAQRSNNGVGQNVTLAFNGTFWNNSFGSVSNDIESATYQYKETTSSSWNLPTALTVSKSGANFSYSGTIDGDLLAAGFSVEKSFNIRVTVKDKLATKTYDIILGAGTPALAIYKDRVAIGGKYNLDVGGTFQLSGLRNTEMTYSWGVIRGPIWIKIGTINFAGQGNSAWLDCVSGNGQNGYDYQNTFFRLILKQGWAGTELPISITAEFLQNYNSEFKFKIKHLENASGYKNIAEIYMYCPFAYTDLTYSLHGFYNSFIPGKQGVDTYSSEPTGDKDATIYYLNPQIKQ